MRKNKDKNKDKNTSFWKGNYIDQNTVPNWTENRKDNFLDSENQEIFWQGVKQNKKSIFEDYQYSQWKDTPTHKPNDYKGLSDEVRLYDSRLELVIPKSPMKYGIYDPTPKPNKYQSLNYIKPQPLQIYKTKKEVDERFSNVSWGTLFEPFKYGSEIHKWDQQVSRHKKKDTWKQGEFKKEWKEHREKSHLNIFNENLAHLFTNNPDIVLKILQERNKDMKYQDEITENDFWNNNLGVKLFKDITSSWIDHKDFKNVDIAKNTHWFLGQEKWKDFTTNLENLKRQETEKRKVEQGETGSLEDQKDGREMKENKDDMTWKFLFDEHNYCKDLHEYVGHKHPELKEPITPFEINPFLWDSEVYIRERDTTLSDSKRLNDAYDRLDDMLFAKLEKIKMTPTFDLIAKKMIFGHYESPNSGKFLIDKINIDDMLRTNEGRTTILEKMKTDKSTHSMVFFGTFKLVDGEKDEIEIR